MLPGASTYAAGEAVDWFAAITFPTYTMTRALQMLMINAYHEDACVDYTEAVCDAITETGQMNPCCDGR